MLIFIPMSIFFSSQNFSPKLFPTIIIKNSTHAELVMAQNDSEKEKSSCPKDI